MGRLAAFAVFLLASATSAGLCAGPAATAPPSGLDASPATPGEDGVKTLKERLSDKASDEQRVDNCGVPLDRRGQRLRPGCAGATGYPAASGGDSGTAARSLVDQGSASK
jgi:hypothetical protein